MNGAAPGLVLSSPLRRALDTCRLAGYGADVQLDDDLVEWDYGKYEGLTRQEIRQQRPGWDLFRDGCPGGESIEDVAGRVSRVISRLRAAPEVKDAPALVFAHGHVLRVFAAVWAAIGPRSARALPFETGAVGVLGWAHEDPGIVRWNA